MSDIHGLLRFVKESGGSDLHLSTGVAPRIRLHGDLNAVEGWPPLTNEQVVELMRPVTPASMLVSGQQGHEADFAISEGGVGRFRVNFFLQEHGASAAFRLIPENITPLEKLALPPAVDKLVHMRSGLVLVTGPTGSGKSTTLAGIIDRINSTYARHIVTIEDPIEFVHPNKKSVISHRQVGTDTPSFVEGVRAAVREDVDVLLVGEMRDPETMARAIDAAEMGLLVFSTVHSNSAARTIDRIVDVFPAAQQSLIRTVLADSLLAILSQTLLRTTDGKGRVAAVELLFKTQSLTSIVRDGNTTMIDSVIQSGKQDGMQSLDEALAVCFLTGKVTYEDAYNAAKDPTWFARRTGRLPPA